MKTTENVTSSGNKYLESLALFMKEHRIEYLKVDGIEIKKTSFPEPMAPPKVLTAEEQAREDEKDLFWSAGR